MFRLLIFKSIRFYQKILSPDQGIINFSGQRRVCRFYPSCSEYCYLAVEKYGIFRGLWRAIKRISRCHPWNAGGVDFP